MLRRRQAEPRDSLAGAPGLAATLKPMLRLAAPVLGEQILLMMVQLSDTVLTGRRLEETHLAAMSQMAYVMWFLTNLFVAVDSGATALARIIHEAAAAGRWLPHGSILDARGPLSSWWGCTAPFPPARAARVSGP